MTIRVLIPLSGGKDSQAVLKLALETRPRNEIRAILCDTKWEHPLTYAHIEEMQHIYGAFDIVTVNDGDVPAQIRKHKQFPLGGARFCTEELKIWPMKRYCKSLATEQGGFEVWYGMRTGEGHKRAKRYANKVCDEVYLPHEVLAKYPQYLGKLGVRFRLPILDWSTAQVFAYLEGKHNPLYNNGFDRVGCFPCMAAGDSTKERAYAFDHIGRDRQRVIRILEAETGKSSWSSKTHENNACALMCGD